MRINLTILFGVLTVLAVLPFHNCVRVSSDQPNSAPSAISSNLGGDGGQTYSGKRGDTYVHNAAPVACSDGELYDAVIQYDGSAFVLIRSNCANLATALNVSKEVAIGVGQIIYDGQTFDLLKTVFVTYASNEKLEHNLAVDARDGSYAKPTWDGNTPVNFQVTVNSGVVMAAPSTSAPALKVTGLPPGTLVTLVNNGKILGAGGAGGNGGYAVAGGDGGPALDVSVTLNIVNFGTIAGGGGGGGGGGQGCWYGGGGGGGGGAGGSPGPSAQIANVDGSYVGGLGSAGSISAGGSGGTPSSNNASAGAGGRGGDLGQPGQAGVDGASINGCYHPGANGGAAGPAIVGINNVKWSTRGTILGPTR